MNPASPIASNAPEPTGRRPGARGWLARLGRPHALALLLVLVTLALFWPAIGHPFMAIDDSEYVTDHPLVPQGLTWLGVGFAFTAKHSGNWHPLTTISHMLDCQLFGVNPAGHHFVNILLHALNAALVFWVLRLMTGCVWRSFFVAAFFALHPLRVESVAWVSERKDVLSVFFFLLTLWAYGRYAQRPSRVEGRGSSAGVSAPSPPAPLPSDGRGWPPGRVRAARGARPWSLDYSLALLFFALGLMSKPMLVTLPFVLLLLDYWPLKRWQFGPRLSTFDFRLFGRLLREKIPFFALSLLVSYITSQVQQTAMTKLSILPVATRVWNMFLSYGQYLAKTFCPINLAVVYPYNLTPPVWEVATAVGLFVALSVLAWRFRERLPWWLVGWLWFVGTLIPVIGLVQVGIQAHADRYTYLPSIGLLVFVVWTVASLVGIGAPDRAGRPASSRLRAASATGSLELETGGDMPVENRRSGGPTLQRPLAFLAFGLLVMLAVLTRAQLAHWENSEKLMLHTERVAGSSELVRGSLGLTYFQEGRLEEAEQQYRLGLKLDGNAWPSVLGLAEVYAAQGKPAEAERLYRRALAGQPNPASHLLLGDFLQDQQRLDEARIHYLQCLATAPYHAGARNQLGMLYAKQQNWPAAREQFERALQLNPKAAGTHHNLGNLLAIQGDPAQAMQHFTRALHLNPAHAEARNSLGYALASQGNLDEAIQHYRKALAVRPDFAAAHCNLAEALARRGELDPARSHFEAALKYQTNYSKAHLGLAGVLAARRQPAEVAHHLREAIRLDPQNPEPLNNLAWLLATHKDAAFRNGAEAVRLAARAVELTRTNDVEMLDTLAAAYAEAGQFAQAVAVARQAIELGTRIGQTQPLTAISNRLESYRNEVPFRAQ